MICDIEHFPTKAGVNIWTARGKMFMKSVKDTSLCLLSFSETHLISNSQRYVPMKFYPLIAPCQVMKMSLCTQSREIGLKLSPMCTAREKYICSWRFTSVGRSFQNFMKIYFLFTKLRSYEISVQIPLTQLFKIFNRRF